MLLFLCVCVFCRSSHPLDPRFRRRACQLLEKQLKRAAAEERKSGIDLSELRAQIKKEIAEIVRRL